MQKSAVIEAILEALRREFDTFVATSRRTRATGNDAQTKSEGKYDTRSTEENYLADGLSRRAWVAREAHGEIARLPLIAFAPGTPIGLGCLVELALAGETLWFLLAPAAGGLEVKLEGRNVTVLTLESPLGSQLCGLLVGGKTRQPESMVLQIL